MKKLLIILLFVFPVVIFAQSQKDYVRQGNKLYKSRKYGDAEVQYRKGLEKDHNSVKAEYNLGNSLYKQDKPDESAEKYLDIISKSRDKSVQSKAYYNLGNSLLKSKKYQESINAYKNSLKLNPADFDSKYNLEYAKRMIAQQQQQQQQKQQNQNNKNQQQQQQQQQNQNKDNNKNQQQQQQQKISRQDSERMLKALQDEEKKVQKDLKKKARASAGEKPVEKNW